MIVDVAFVVVPSILGLGAAGLIGSSAIRTAKDVMNSISVLRAVGPLGWMAGKGLKYPSEGLWCKVATKQ
jgi:hypothetical protein